MALPKLPAAASSGPIPPANSRGDIKYARAVHFGNRTSTAHTFTTSIPTAVIRRLLKGSTWLLAGQMQLGHPIPKKKNHMDLTDLGRGSIGGKNW